MRKLFVFGIVVLAFGVFLVQHSSVYAAEGGVGHYVPGALADFGDMAPASGLALLSWYNHYNGSAGGGREISFDFTKDGRIVPIVSNEISFGGIIASSVKATSNRRNVRGALHFALQYPWRQVLYGHYHPLRLAGCDRHH